MNAIRVFAPAFSASLLAGLLAACNTDLETRAGITPLSAEPATTTTRTPDIVILVARFAAWTQNATAGAYVQCSPPAGLPSGVSADAPTLFEESDTANHTCTLRLHIGEGAVPGRYTVQAPSWVCARAEDDFTPGQNPTACATASVSFTLDIGGDPPPPPGTGWQALGGVLNLDPKSFTAGPALAVDASDVVHAAFVENERPVVRRWALTDWQTLGEITPTGPAEGTPALTFDAEGAPVLAWTEQRPGDDGTHPTQVQVRRWSGNAWLPLGNSPVDSVGALSARAPALLLSGGRLLLAWSEDADEAAGGSRLQVRRWDGTAWVDFGASAVPAPGQPLQTALAAVDAGRVAVGWRNGLDGRVRIAEGQGTAWTLIGDLAAANAQSFALASTGSGLLLAVAPSAPSAAFTVQRWDGAAWQRFGTLQGTTVAAASVPYVALGQQAADGVPLLAWSESTTTRREFHVRRWNGADWYPVGDPRPTLGRSANGTNLRLAVTGGTVPVVATEVSQGAPDSDITIRVQAFR